jgi:mannose-1-phosphate guanylyltransferase
MSLTASSNLLSSECTAIVLAGGAGSRLGPLTSNVPKPMLPISGRPFVEYLVVRLAEIGILDVVMTVGYRGDVVRGYFGDGSRWGVSIRYASEMTPLGTGGALRAGAVLASHDRLVGLNADSFVDCDMLALVRDCEANASIATIALTSADASGRYGAVVTDDHGWVTAFSEKAASASQHANAGAYACTREIIEWIPAGAVSLEHRVLPELAAARRLRGIPVPGFFVDIGAPSTYQELAQDPGPFLRALGAAARNVAESP